MIYRNVHLATSPPPPSLPAWRKASTTWTTFTRRRRASEWRRSWRRNRIRISDRINRRRRTVVRDRKNFWKLLNIFRKKNSFCNVSIFILFLFFSPVSFSQRKFIESIHYNKNRWYLQYSSSLLTASNIFVAFILLLLLLHAFILDVNFI